MQEVWECANPEQKFPTLAACQNPKDTFIQILNPSAHPRPVKSEAFGGWGARDQDI